MQLGKLFNLIEWVGCPFWTCWAFSFNFKIGLWIVTNFKWLLSIMLLYSLVTLSCEIIWQIEKISATTVPKVVNNCRGVTYDERVLPIELHEPWITWFLISCDKLKASPTTLSMATKLVNLKILKSLDHVVLRDHMTN